MRGYKKERENEKKNAKMRKKREKKREFMLDFSTYSAISHRAQDMRPSILNPRTKNGQQTAYAVRII